MNGKKDRCSVRYRKFPTCRYPPFTSCYSYGKDFNHRTTRACAYAYECAVGAACACTHLPVLETESSLACVQSHVKASLSTPTQDPGQECGHFENAQHDSRTILSPNAVIPPQDASRSGSALNGHPSDWWSGL